jgi:hypothetical protein
MTDGTDDENEICKTGWREFSSKKTLETNGETETTTIQKTMSPSPSSGSDDLEKKISDVIRMESNIIAFSILALGFLLSAISAFNQISFESAKIGNPFYGSIPLGPTILNSTFMIVVDAVSLSTGLFGRIAPFCSFDV